MDDKKSSNAQHLLHAALVIVHARSAFETAVAFWRPWFREPEKTGVASRQHSKAASEEAPEATKPEQEATVAKNLKVPTKPVQRPKPLAQEATVEKNQRVQTKRTEWPKPLTQEATMEKNPKKSRERSLKNEQELERDERAHKTERLRKLRLAKEVADREKNASSNGVARTSR
jgi:hypothetical protein